MSKKTRILAAIMAVLVLVGSLALAVSADGETRSDLTEKELPADLERLPAENSREVSRSGSSVYLDYSLPDSDYYQVEWLYTESNSTCEVLLLFDQGYYCSFQYVAGSDDRSISVESLGWGTIGTIVLSFPVYSENHYAFDTGYNDGFLLNEDYVLSISLGGVYLVKTDDYMTYKLSDYMRFAVLNYSGTNYYFGCTEDDFITEVTPSDLPSLYCGGSSAPTTLTDWFFDTAFPVFGSVDADSIDLGILGNYQPIQLYKFLFSLSLVVVAIVLLVWLPMYGLFRLLGIKRKKR